MTYSIGPFTVDDGKKRVTLEPGVYRLSKPITFGPDENINISGVEYEGRVWASKSPGMLKGKDI